MSSTRFMARMQVIGYIAVLLGALGAATGCGKSDKGPPPGATTTELKPPEIDLELPTDDSATSTKSAESTGTPPAAQGDKK